MSRISEAMVRAYEDRPSPDLTPDTFVASVTSALSLPEEGIESAPWTFESATAAASVLPVVPTIKGTRRQVAQPPAPLPRPPLVRAETAVDFRGVNPQLQERIVNSGAVPPYAVEQFRRFAATLHQAQVDRGVRVVMVTSAVLGEGKSLTSTNLALTLSESYRRRVLLVDADLRRPSLHNVFQIGNADGLSGGLRREQSSTFATVGVTDALSVLPAGEPDPDPMASLTSARMKQLIDESRSKFDWVVIDTPPVALMPDASLLAGMADGVVLVIRAGVTPLEIVKQAIKAIGRKRILGTVLNHADHEPVAGYSTY